MTKMKNPPSGPDAEREVPQPDPSGVVRTRDPHGRGGSGAGCPDAR